MAMVTYGSALALAEEKAAMARDDVTDKEDHVTKMAAPKVTTHMILKTVSLILSYLVMGLYLELISPTLPDLMQKLNVNFEEISRALVIHSAGYFISCIVSGILTDKLPGHVDLFLSVAFLLATVGTGLAPWVSHLGTLSLLLLCRGLSQGCLDIFCNFQLMKIWHKRASAPIHALHFSFGVGAFIIPQIARPFLGKNMIHYNGTLHEYVDTSTVYEIDMERSVNLTSNSSEEVDYVTSFAHNSSNTQWVSQIEIPYSIIAFLTGVFSVLFLVFHLFEKKVVKNKQLPSKYKKGYLPERPPPFRDMFSPASCTNGDTKFGVFFFTAMFFFNFNLVGSDNTIGRFLYSFATESELEFTVKQGAALNSLYWICFTCGRGLTILIAKYVPARIMLFVEAGLNVTCAVVLLVWGYDYPLVLWIFVGVLGISISPVMPTGLAWANRYVVMNGVSVALLFSGGASGSMIYQWLTGFLFENYGPHLFLYVILGYAVFLALSVVVLQLLVCNRLERFEEEAVEININVEHVENRDVMNIKASECEKLAI